MLLLGILILAPDGPAQKLPVSSASQFAAASWTPSELASDGKNSHRVPSRLPLGQLPLRFEPNQGQTDPRVKFLARGAGYGVFLTPDQAVLTLGARAKSAVVGMQLAGANPNAAVSGNAQLPGKSNYFIGSNPAKWHRDIPQFARVRYQGVYPGVDLVYYGNQGQLEYDFEVAPGADPRSIALQFEGPQRPHLDGNGDLILGTGGGEARLKAPRS